MKPQEQVEVTAEALDEHGHGTGSAAGVEVCALDWLPGERARVQIEHRSPHRPRAWGRVVERLGPGSAHRVAPACPAFGRCGGCAWQHLAYPAQLAHKQARVEDALGRAGVDAIVEPVIAAPAITGYRNVGKYVAAGAPGAGTPRLVLGAYAPGTHEVVDMSGCQIVEPVIERVRSAACVALDRLAVHDERARTGVLRYVVVRSGEDGRCLVAVVTTSQAARPEVAAAADALATHADVRGVVWVRNDARSSTLLAGDVEPLTGAPFVIERVAGVEIHLGVRDFFQVNRAQAARLYAEVARLGRAGAPGAAPLRAVDVYCGVGGIAFTLAGDAGPARDTAGPVRDTTSSDPAHDPPDAAHDTPDALSVLGIEHNAAAVSAAARAAERAGLSPRVRFVAGQAADLPRLMAGAAPDLVVVNPPRKGLDAATRDALAALAPPRLVYVSCGPASLARDLATLPAYRVERARPVDLMPGTPQIETVVSLSRRG